MARIDDLLCKALEMIDSDIKHYSEAAKTCEGPAQEVFSHLEDEMHAHRKRIASIYEGLREGKEFEGVCILEDKGDADSNILPMARAMIEKYGIMTSCKSDLTAVNEGMDRVYKAEQFYEQWAQKATPGMEQDFAKRMVQEQRGLFMMLSDLQTYYEDPEGYETPAQ